MAGALGQQNNEMVRRMQLEHLERQRRWIQAQPTEMCPRCFSMDTKFCYFNNYSADQPRYYCKSCSRSWTKGGRLRNIPVGGRVRPARPPTFAPQIQNPVQHVTSPGTFIVPPAVGTGPGGTGSLSAVNQPFGGGHVLNQQVQNLNQPFGGGHVLNPQVQNLQAPEPQYIFYIYRYSRVVSGWVNVPFNGTSFDPLP